LGEKKLKKFSSKNMQNYYQHNIEQLSSMLSVKAQDLRRLEAQRNALNAKGLTLTFAYY
jgi:hypothetical protein